MASIKRSLSTRVDSAGYSEILLRVIVNRNQIYRIKSGVNVKTAEMDNLHLEIDSRIKFREWLRANYETASDVWVSVKRGMPNNDESIFWYIDAVEEALCYGWIDSTTKKLENGVTVQRFAPRRKGSIWSELNKARCERMERMGLMTDAGRKLIPTSPFEIMPEIMEVLQADKVVWDNFQKLPGLYRRVRIDTIQIKRKDKALFEARLAKFIEATRAGVMIGQWNDNGRLQ